MGCKFLFETNYAVYVCAAKAFNALNCYGTGGPGACDVCNLYEHGEPDAALIKSFKEFDKADTKRREQAEIEMDRAWTFSAELAELNTYHRTGEQEKELAYKKELESKYEVTLELWHDKNADYGEIAEWIYMPTHQIKQLKTIEDWWNK